MNVHVKHDEAPVGVFDIEPGQIERNLQAAIDDVVERYGDEARHLVADAFVNAITQRKPRR